MRARRRGCGLSQAGLRAAGHQTYRIYVTSAMASTGVSIAPGGAVRLAVISAAAASYTASLTRDSVPQALASGYDLAMAVAAGLTLVAAVVAVTAIRVGRTASARPAAATKPGEPVVLGKAAG